MDLSESDSYVSDKDSRRVHLRLPYSYTRNNDSPRTSYLMNNILGLRSRTESAMNECNDREFGESNPLYSSTVLEDNRIRLIFQKSVIPI